MASVEIASTSPVLAPLSVPLRNIFLTLALTITTLALAGYFWRETGYEMLIVTMGWPHVILGFLFYVGRVLRNESGSRASFVFLTALTLVLCTTHYFYSITAFIYLYFLFHLFRDEIFVYLQTRARHRSLANVYSVAGLAPLILLLLLIPQRADFRQDMRRIEFQGGQVSKDWTLIPFRPVQNSSGREFYFYLESPHTAGLQTFVIWGTEFNSRKGGKLLVGDRPWSDARDLIFYPHYDGYEPAAAAGQSPPESNVLVWLTGGHKIGQTFVAEKDNLRGIWLPIRTLNQPSNETRFVFHLASPPLLPYSGLEKYLRNVLLVILAAIVVWRLIPRRGQSLQLWIYLAVLAGSFAIIQNVLKRSSNAGYAVPLIFQFAVVFHYWSWYVFSFDKLHMATAPTKRQVLGPAYDRLLGLLRSPNYFTFTVIGLNLISAVGVLWYYQFAGGGALKYLFDYSYFLYILVFHVTFSFRPRLRFGT